MPVIPIIFGIISGAYLFFNNKDNVELQDWDLIKDGDGWIQRPEPPNDNLLELDSLVGDFTVTKAVGWFALGFALLKYGR